MIRKGAFLIFILLGLSGSSGFAQNPIINGWQSQHSECVERIIQLWLEDPINPDINVDLAKLVRLEVNLKLAERQINYFLDRVDANRPLPPQLFVIYLQERGTRMSPEDIFLGKKFLVVKELPVTQPVREE